MVTSIEIPVANYKPMDEKYISEINFMCNDLHLQMLKILSESQNVDANQSPELHEMITRCIQDVTAYAHKMIIKIVPELEPFTWSFGEHGLLQLNSNQERFIAIVKFDSVYLSIEEISHAISAITFNHLCWEKENPNRDFYEFMYHYSMDMLDQANEQIDTSLILTVIDN